jgi:hypothetical protein
MHSALCADPSMAATHSCMLMMHMTPILAANAFLLLLVAEEEEEEEEKEE